MDEAECNLKNYADKGGMLSSGMPIIMTTSFDHQSKSLGNAIINYEKCSIDYCGEKNKISC